MISESSLKPPNVDSRHFPVSRIASIGGYNDFPLIDDTLAFKLPRFRQFSGKLVAIGQRSWELWSPNSRQFPFFPGVLLPDFLLSCPEDETRRRYDGHLGRFDFTVSPQYLSEQFPWRGFILRPGTQQASLFPEYLLLHQKWHSLTKVEGMIETQWIDSLMFRLNALDAEMASCSRVAERRPDLWDVRPSYPHVDEVTGLRRIRSFNIAVDAIARIQRGIKDRAAWLVMIKLLLAEDRYLTPDEFRAGFVPPACEDYMGTWINGSDERDALWLMSKAMPCFVIHKLVGQERYTKRGESVPDFLSGTDAVLLHYSHNGFDHIAQRSGHTPTPHEPYTGRVQPLRLDSRDRQSSSPPAQGWLGTTIGITLPPTVQVVEPALTANADIDPTERFDLAAPGYTALPLDYQELDPGRVPWLKPPSVQSVPPGKKWEKWACETTESNCFMKLLGRKGKHKRWVYYDRENLRELSLSQELQQPIGLVSDVKIFGQPAPALLYLQQLDKGWRQR